MFNLKSLSKKTIGLGLLYIVVKWSLIILVGGYVYQAGLWRNEYFFFLPVIFAIGVGVFLWKKNRKKKTSVG
jgi:hypothetical protein